MGSELMRPVSQDGTAAGAGSSLFKSDAYQLNGSHSNLFQPNAQSKYARASAEQPTGALGRGEESKGFNYRAGASDGTGQ